MILIVGGAFQGKHEFAKKLYPDKTVYELSELLGKEPDVSLFKDGIYVSTLIGCGIVPMDSDERNRREEVGILQTFAAKTASEVYVVTAGIGQKIK